MVSYYNVYENYDTSIIILDTLYLYEENTKCVRWDY